MPPPLLVLGADLSTDSLQYVVCDAADGSVAAEGDFKHLDRFGQKYGLKVGGYIELPDGVVRVPYGMLTDGIDIMLEDVGKKLGNDRKHMKRACVSLQQHGMGAWSFKSSGLLAKIGSNPNFLVSQHEEFPELFTTDYATSWRDTASKQDAEGMEQNLSADEWARITGSSPMQALRFLGAQAKRLHRVNPQAWDATYQLNVLASIVASFLVGNNVGIGLDEASCTLAMNLEKGLWDQGQLGPYYPNDFFRKLPPILNPGARVGRLWSYHVQRHKLPEDCQVLMGMGDNIAIMMTMANQPGQFGLSLGSSGTTYCEMDKPTYDKSHACHVLRSGTGKFMGMYCSGECGKVAEQVCVESGMDFRAFDHNVETATIGNDEMVIPGPGGLTYVAVNIGTPQCAPAVTRSILADMKLKSSFMGDPESIVATGGFAKPAVGKVIADLFQRKTFLSPKMNRVAWGSLVMAVADVTGRPIPEIAAQLCPKGEEIHPNPAVAKDYEEFLENYRRQTGG